MDNRSVYSAVFDALKQRQDRQTCKDMISCLVNWSYEDPLAVVEAARPVRKLFSECMAESARAGDYEKAERFRSHTYDTLLITAPNCLDDYMQALEFDRPVRERFYLPRRAVLLPFVQALEDMTYDRLDELFLSCPPRVGKTTLLMIYETWLMGRNSELHNLYTSYSDIITGAFYSGILEILRDNVTYKWGDIFPTARIKSTKADEKTIDIDRNKRYKTLTCRSLYGTLNGACDADGTLIADDLIGSIEEAMSKDRLVNAWSKVDNNLLPRAKEHCKILWIGTRWSMIDPMGLREDLLRNDAQFKGRRFKVIDLPAMNENDESNFDYDYGVGFSTEYFRQRRASFERMGDMASWLAQYMCTPIEREGTVFAPQDMRMFNGVLPEQDPDRVFLATDPAWGGGDYVAGPVCAQYGDDVYVVDVVFTNEDKTKSQPDIAKKAKRNNVGYLQIEANKMTEDYKNGVESALKNIGYHCTVQTKPAPTSKSKEQRIFDKAPDIKEHFIFLEDGKRSKEYQMFMQQVYSFKITGKNKHDDAPDSLAMAADMLFRKQSPAARAIPRLF